MEMMKAAVFEGPGRIALGRKPVPQAGPGEAIVKVTMTTICGTDVHILKGEYPVAPGLTVGHEPVGVIAASDVRAVQILEACREVGVAVPAAVTLVTVLPRWFAV